LGSERVQSAGAGWIFLRREPRQSDTLPALFRGYLPLPLHLTTGPALSM
jgi:hypothetical protein